MKQKTRICFTCCTLLMILICFSCTGPQKKAETQESSQADYQTKTSPQKEKLPSPPPPPKDVSQTFTFEEKASLYYEAPNDLSILTNRERAIFSQFTAKLKSDKKTKPELNSNLSLLAKEILRYYDIYQQKPPVELLKKLRLHFGIAVPQLEYAILDNSQAALQKLEEQYKTAGFNTLGIHVANSVRYTEKVCLIFVNKQIYLEPIPKNVTSEHRFKLSGKCLADNCILEARLMFFGEKVFENSIRVRKGNFNSEIQIPSALANYKLKIINSADGKNTIVTQATIYSKPVQSTSFTPGESSMGCKDDKQCQQKAIELINQYRTQHDLIPLTNNSILQKIASAHAKDMLENNYISLFDRNGSSLMHWLAANNYQTLQSAEIVSGGYSIQDVVDNFKTNKTYENYLKNAFLTDIGCGVASKRSKRESYSAVSCVVVTIIDDRQGSTLYKAVFNRINKFKQEKTKKKFRNASTFQDLADISLNRLIEKPQSANSVQEDVKMELETSSTPVKDSVFGVFTIYTLDQLQYIKVVQDLVNSERNNLAISVKKVMDPNTEMKGIFVYYISYR